MEEKQAIELLKQGDLLGLEYLTRQYYYQAVKAAYLVTRDEPEAEDIVQNAFIKATEKIRQLRSERFGPWFMRIVINSAIRTAKKQNRNVSLHTQVGEDGESLEDFLLDQMPSPESQVEIDDLSQEIWEKLQQLTPEQRAAVVMKYYLDMSEEEITRYLDKPVSTIKWRLYSARQHLKALLQPVRYPSTSKSEQKPFVDEK